jgi:hypothetical protein
MRSDSVWKEEDLVRRLCQVLEVANKTVKALAPSGYKNSSEPDGEVRSEKIVSETALLLLLVADAGKRYEELGKQIDSLVKTLIPYARSEKVRVGICLNPSLARDYAFAHACLSRLGYPDSSVDVLMKQSLSSLGLSRERLPHRALEQEWLRRVWNPDNLSFQEIPNLVQQSMIGNCMNAFTSSRDDIYAFTHAIMYFTDLGTRYPLMPRSRREIIADADAALARCLDEQDYDLAGEVLLTWTFMNYEWSPTASFGFSVLASVEDKVGFLPASITCVDHYFSLQSEERSNYFFATAYHTIYVMGLLCGSSIHSKNFPLTGYVTRGELEGAAAALLQFIDVEQTKRHWFDEFQKLTLNEQDALAPLLLTIALRRATIQYDFVRLRNILEISVQYQLSDEPVVSQAVELIRRVALLNT